MPVIGYQRKTFRFKLSFTPLSASKVSARYCISESFHDLNSVMNPLWLLLLVVYSLSDFPGRVYSQQCVPIAESPYVKDCTLAGYNYTFPLPDNLSGRTKWLIKFVASRLTKDMKNCSVAQIAETIGCALIAPNCQQGKTKPLLPCRRVCSEFLKRCIDKVPSWYIDDLTGKCTLLPDDTKESGNCYEPPQFTDEHHNTSHKGPLETGCYDLTYFPFCKELGYKHTIIAPQHQKKVYRIFYKKDYDENDPETPGPGSHIIRVRTTMKNHTKCAKNIHKFFCGRIVPPCFPEEGKAYYSVCQSVCKSVGRDCPDIFQTRGGRYFMACERMAEGTTAHGFCKYTSWPSPKAWADYFHDRAPPAESSLNVPIITVAVVVPIVIVTVVLIVLVILWKKNKLFAFDFPRGQVDQDKLEEKK